MKRRYFAVLLVLVSLLHILSGCGLFTGPTSESEPIDEAGQQSITRAEWIMLLGQEMGMEDYQSETPYYRDVPSSSDAYPYIQSCREWGVLSDSKDGQFYPDDVATPDFIASTAALATGIVPDESLDDPGAIEDFAQQRGLVPPAGNSVSITNALQVAETTRNVYLSNRHTDTLNIDWADGVIDLTSSSQISVQDSLVTVPTDQAEALTVGSVFVAPSSSGDVALKVTGITVQNGITVLQTEEPDLGEVFDELAIYECATPDVGSIQLAEGISMGPAANGLTSSRIEGVYANRLVATPDDGVTAYQTEGFSTTLSVNFTSGKVSVTPEWNDIKATVDRLVPSFPVDTVIGASPQRDLSALFEKSSYIASVPITKDGLVQIDKNGWERHLEVKNKFEAGYDITGSITIENLYVNTGFEFKKVFGIPTGIKHVSVAVNYDISTNLTLSGSLSNELSIGTIPIPIAGGIATVEVELILYLDVSGELMVRADLSNNVKYEYNNGNIKKTNGISNSSVTSEFAVEAETGPKLQITFDVLKIKIIDVSVSAGVNLSISAYETIDYTTNKVDSKEIKTWTMSVGLEGKVCAPIVKLSVGYSNKTLANKLNIKGQWTLISKEKSPFVWKPELLNKEVPIWTYSETTEVSESDDENANEESSFTFGAFVLVLSGSSQTVDVQALNGNAIPKLVWASEDTSVATVNNAGVVTPVSTGVTTVTATNQDNQNEVVKCTIIVQEIGESNWEFLPADMAVA